MQPTVVKRSSVPGSPVIALLVAVPRIAGGEPRHGFQAGIQGGYENDDLGIRSSNLAVDDPALPRLSNGFNAGANTAVPGQDRIIAGLEGSFTFNNGDRTVAGGGDRISTDSRHRHSVRN